MWVNSMIGKNDKGGGMIGEICIGSGRNWRREGGGQHSSRNDE